MISNLLKLNSTKAVAVIVSALVLGGSVTTVQADVLTARPLTPQEIHDNHLPSGTHASGGLLTVGVGEPVYLEALIGQDPVVGGVTWNLMSSPAGSSAFIDVSPIPMEMQIYSPADREVYQLAGRRLLRPDVKGTYLVEAVVSTSAGDIPLSAFITAADYVGSGIVNDPAWTAPSFPQCALCHSRDPDGKVASFMETGHATFIEEAIDGIKSSHYSENCIDCHVLGGHVPDAQNDNFFNVADSLGWNWPTVLKPGNWAAMPLALKEKANIQCESCHGAGSEHYGWIEGNQISKSLNSGDCAQCHDEEPYHNRNRQWENSRHSVATRYPTGPNRGSCVECHSGIGFIEEMDGVADANKSTAYEAIVCAACHDPHSNHGENHQLRSSGDITLKNGEVITMGGNGKFCMNCHKGRQNAVEYVKGNVSSHFGPHYGIQGDLFHGTNAYEYDGKVIGSPSVHAYLVEDSCTGCHMQSIPNSSPARDEAGGHTFRMTWDNGTPDNHDDDMPMTGVCTECHGPTDSFDMPRYDYNYDGVVEGLQTEVHHLLEALAMKLHPAGSPEVIRGDSSHTYTDAEKRALYNYLCVEEDGSFGMHNPRYITELLRASINDLGDPLNSVLNGLNIPAGGPWYYSSWFDFYSPTGVTGWIYHVTHGYLFVDKDDSGNLLIWDKALGKWLYTNADLYPVLLDLESGSWMYFQGKFGDVRYFYNFGSGAWDLVE